MLIVQRFALAAASGLCLGAALADELKVTPMAVIDAVAYGDDADGRGTEYLQNANGIFNVHSDHGDGHSHGGSLDRGLNLRGVELE
ncbi:MAG: hypothetical protein AB1713_03280, partial [Pseudomonadota bacterium]